MDWVICKVLSWCLLNMMYVDFCVEVLKEVIGQFGLFEIMNIDQGLQFIGFVWIIILIEVGVCILMDGCGCCMDNIFIERFWWFLKQEVVYF